MRVSCDRHRSARTGADIFLSFLDWAHLVFGAHQRSVQAPCRNEAPARARSLRHAIGTPRPFLHATLHNLGITPLSASTPVCGISKIGQIGGVGAGVVTNYRPTRTRLYQTKRDFDLCPRCTPTFMALRPRTWSWLNLAWALVSAVCVPVGGDIYDDVALFDKPWA